MAGQTVAGSFVLPGDLYHHRVPDPAPKTATISVHEWDPKHCEGLWHRLPGFLYLTVIKKLLRLLKHFLQNVTFPSEAQPPGRDSFITTHNNLVIAVGAVKGEAVPVIDASHLNNQKQQ